MQNDKSISRNNIIGWALTIILSLSSAAGVVNSRVYELEKQLEIVKIDLENTKLQVSTQRSEGSKNYEMLVRIDKAITEINGILNTKADKYENTRYYNPR